VNRAPQPSATAPVTITGCLANDNQHFTLRKTSGGDAPKARSWRFGFFKRRASDIEIVDPANVVDLQSYVGDRVSATGILSNKDMRLRSMRRVGGGCN
jgi:hypothetical protein